MEKNIYLITAWSLFWSITALFACISRLPFTLKNLFWLLQVNSTVQKCNNYFMFNLEQLKQSLI